MSEDYAVCVRGCKRQCREDACLAGEPCEHHTGIRATVGLLCVHCSERLRQAVDEIPDLYAQLPGLYDTSGTGEGEKTHSRRVSGSPALIRLDVMVLTGQGGPDGDVWGTLYGWLRIIDQELGLKPQGYTLTEVSTFLRTWHRKIAEQHWADEYWTDVVGLWTSLRRATGTRPIGRCWGRVANKANGGCGRMLYPPRPGEDTVVCPNEQCGRTYTGAEVIKLAIQAEREGVA